MKSFLSIPLLLLSIAALAQPTLKKRVIATSYFANGSLQDSNRYYYSYGRGSEHTNAESYYDNYLRGSDAEQNIHCDSSANYVNFGGTMMMRLSGKSYHYNSNNLPDNFIYSNIANYRQYCIITRNTYGKPVSINYRDTSGSGIPMGNYTRYLTYNSALYLTVDSSYNFVSNTPYFKNVISYDASNNDTLISTYTYNGGNWLLTGLIRKTFDVQNRLIVKVVQQDTGTGMHYTQTDSFGYRGTDTFQNYHVIYNWNSNVSQWIGVERYYTYFSSNKLTDTFVINQWNSSWDTLERIVTHYDTDGLIQYAQSYEYNGGGVYDSVPYDRTTFYFQTYDPTSIVTTEKVADITVTPNPSKGIIAVNTNTTTFSHVSITDMQGRIVYRQHVAETNSATINTQLSAGTYILTIHDKQQAKINSTQIIIQ